MDAAEGAGTAGGDTGDDVVDFDELLARWSAETALEDELAEVLGQPSRDWISLAAAEEVAGVSRSTLRAWYRSGRIPSRLMPGPHGLQRLVPRDAVVEQAARSPRSGSTSSVSGGSSDDQTGRTASRTPAPAPAPAEVVRLAELAVVEARHRAESAESRAASAEAALHAALERAAGAEAELRVLRERDT
jgi:hypothetical protein